jgi:acyl dehydratase
LTDTSEKQTGPQGRERIMGNYLYFDDLEVGHAWESPARTVTESDIVNFACLTGDFDPLHVNHAYAATTPFGKPIAHGLLGLSMLAGLGSQFPAVRTLAFLRIREWKFCQPIFIGDTVRAINEVEELEDKGRRGGKVIWRRQLVNQRNEVVQEGFLETFVARRSDADPSASAVHGAAASE